MIFDLHNDLLTSEILDKEQAFKSYAEHTRGVVLAFWSTNSTCLPDCSALLNNGAYFAVEDMHFFREGMTEELLKLSPVYCGLTWNYDNGLAGGAMDGGTLTSWGMRVIDILNENAIPVDLAHLNRKSFYQVIDKADKVICSHTAIDLLKSHNRNLTDEQIKLIIEKGGVIGLSPVRDFIKNSGAIEDFAQTIDYALSRFGDKNFAIGTDINGSTDFCPELSLYGGYNDLEKILISYGHEDNTINNLFYHNAERFVKTALSFNGTK